MCQEKDCPYAPGECGTCYNSFLQIGTVPLSCADCGVRIQHVRNMVELNKLLEET